MSERVDFSGNAAVYDRRHGAVASDVELRQLWEAASLPIAARVLDLGAGTGRLAIPLAGRGCRVIAIDPSQAMLERLVAKDGNHMVQTVAAEGALLPFTSNSLDVVMIARLLYLTSDWKEILEEAGRVLVPGGCLMHQWGNGDADESWVQIREEARRLFGEAGVKSPFHPGVRSESAIERWLEARGFTVEARIAIGSGPETTVRQFLQRLVTGELSYIWNVPPEIQVRTLPVLEAWAGKHFDLEQAMAMPRELRWTILRKSA